MKNYRILILSILMAILSHILMAIEVHTEQSKSKVGEPIATTYYKNEPNGLAKRVLYGTGPKFRLIQLFFEKNCPNFVDHQDYFDINYGILGHPEGLPDHGAIYFRDDNPTEIFKSINFHDSGKNVAELYYKRGNKIGIDFTRSWDNPDGTNVLLEGYYLNVKENTEHIKEYRETYENNLVKLEQILYYPRADFLVKKLNQYLPPEFTQKDNKPWKATSTYQDDPEGLMRIEQENLSDNRGVEDYQYDWKKNSKSYSKVMYYYKSEKLVKKEMYFGRPFENGVWIITIEVNPDDSKTVKYWDAKANEIQLKQ